MTEINRSKQFLAGWKMLAGTILVSAGIIGGTWAFAGNLGVRPTLLREHRALELRVAAGELEKWIQLNRKRQGGGSLTPAEEAAWCTLGLRLGVLKSCA